MKSWIFTTGITRGSYTIIEADGEERDHVGMDLCLGFGKGDNVKEVAKAILTRAFAHRMVPASFTGTLHAFEIGSDTTISMEKKELEDVKNQAMKEEIQPQPKVVSDAVAVGQECIWCGETLPPNAAGKFSHLKKHVGVLVAKEIITIDDAKGIHSLKLKPNIMMAFQKAKEKGLFKEKAS
jgi:hypothetical protein